MTKKTISLPTLLLSTLLVPLLAGGGAEAAERSYDFDTFRRIEINSGADIDIKVGKKQAVKVKADEDVLDRLELALEGETLVIRHKRSLFSNWSGAQPKITIRLRELEDLEINGSADGRVSGLRGAAFVLEVNGSGNLDLSGDVERFGLELNGSGDITGEKLRAGHVDVELNGSGDVKFAGECEILTLEINGSGVFDGEKLKCREGAVDITGSGDAAVYTRDLVQVEIVGSGDVQVHGKPEKVQKEVRRKNQVVIRD